MTPNEPIITYLAVGTLAEEPVMRALLGNHDIEIQRVTIQDYGLRLQKIEDIADDDVRRDMTDAWATRPTDFFGATTMVPAIGEHVEASIVGLTLPQWKEALGRWKEWNYHPKWFKFGKVEVDTPEGKVVGFAENIYRGRLREVPEDYRTNPEYGYQEFISTMADEIYGFRENFLKETNVSRGKEQ